MDMLRNSPRVLKQNESGSYNIWTSIWDTNTPLSPLLSLNITKNMYIFMKRNRVERKLFDMV